MAFPLIFSIFTSVKTNTKSMETFTIRAYGRTELAQFYFPGLNPQTAYRKLQEWIDFYPHLRERLQAAGCHPYLHARACPHDCRGDRGTLGN